MSTGQSAGRFSVHRLLTPKDKQAFEKRHKAGSASTSVLRLLSSRVGWKYVWRVLLSALGGLLGGPIQWFGRRIQAARSPLSPLFWLQRIIRFFYRLFRHAEPLSEAQEARRREAAEALHPQARPLVLALEMFQSKLPHNWGGQYTAFGGVALKAGNDKPSLDLIRHEWAHYWWSHQMTGDERAAFMQEVEALADAPDLPEEMQYAQEVTRATYEARDPVFREGNKKLRIPLQSNDGYRVAYCFNLIDLEVHAYIAQFSRGDASRLPPGLRPFYAGFFPV